MQSAWLHLIRCSTERAADGDATAALALEKDPRVARAGDAGALAWIVTVGIAKDAQ